MVQKDTFTAGGGTPMTRYIAWALRHWFLMLVLIGVIYTLVHVNESEHPRPGYYDTGNTVTSSECRDQGGQVVDDVCYLP